MATAIARISRDDGIAFLNNAKALIEKADSIDVLKQIRDQAEAFRVVAKKAGACREVQNRAADAKLRAERKAGALLATNGFGKKGGDRKSSVIVTLDELGIEKNQSHRWQRLASLPNDRFEAYITESQEGMNEITTAGALRLAKTLKREEKRAGIERAVKQCAPEDLLKYGVKFGCVYADPPWKYGNQATRAATKDHYPGMSVDEICELPTFDTPPAPCVS